MRERIFLQTLHVRVASDTQKIQSSDWPKCRCTLWRYVNPRIFVGHRTLFQAVSVDTLITSDKTHFNQPKGRSYFN